MCVCVFGCFCSVTLITSISKENGPIDELFLPQLFIVTLVIQALTLCRMNALMYIYIFSVGFVVVVFLKI